MHCPRVAVFDLDDTLAESFRPPQSSMINRLKALLERIPIAIVSGGGFPRIEADFLPNLISSSNISNLFILPNSASQCYLWAQDSWQEVYNFALTLDERVRITTVLQESAEKLGLISREPDMESEIIDREAQIAFAAIGLRASLEAKKAWDPDQSKRRRLKEVLDEKLPGFEVLIGGMTTVDITRHGINKAHGIEWLSKHLQIPTHEMYYVGDALYPGGNDAVVIPTGIQTRATKNPDETLHVIDEMLAACSA